MAKKRGSSSRRRDSYTWQTHRPLNCLVFVLPLLLFFHIGTAHYGTSLLAPRDLGRLLRYCGATAAYLPALLILAVLFLRGGISGFFDRLGDNLGGKSNG